MTTTQRVPNRPRDVVGGDVVVGVDGSPSSRAAVEFALGEAVAGPRALRLVVIVDGDELSMPIRGDGGGEATWSVLEQIARSARERHPGIEVRNELHPGHPVDRLVELSRGQHMLVVGKRGLGSFRRMVAGSTSTAVAGRATVPVVVIPDGWQPPGTDGGPIVVDVDVDRDNTDVLRFSFEQAVHRQARAVIVQAISDRPRPMWDPVEDEREKRAVVEGKIRSVEEAVAEVSRGFPLEKVTVARTLQSEPDALLDAADEAQLLVMGRHVKGRFGLPVGSVARNLLHYAELPVAVVPAG
jgi:nucleotide-binding universal stress UspA family protein